MRGSGLKMYGLYFLFKALIMAIVLAGTFSVLELLFFSGLFMAIVFFSVSMSIHRSFAISPLLAPVSFATCRKVASVFPDAEIKVSSSDSNGTNGCLGV